MRHLINTLQHEDNSLQIHYAPTRLFHYKKGDNIYYDEAEHVKTMNHLQKQEMAVMSMNQLDECVVAADTAGP